MRTRRAPNARADNLLIEAINYATALRLMALALVTIKDERGDAVHTVAWAISTRLDRLKRILKRKGTI